MKGFTRTKKTRILVGHFSRSSNVNKTGNVILRPVRITTVVLNTKVYVLCVCVCVCVLLSNM
jgi:hypothetical protein